MKDFKKLIKQKYCAICKNDFLLDNRETIFTKWKIHKKCVWKLILVIMGLLIAVIGIIFAIVFWFFSFKH